MARGNGKKGDRVPDVFSTHSAARFCRVTPMTIIRWVEEGRIRAYRTPGGHRRIMRADLEDFCRRAGIPLQWETHVEGDARRVLIIEDDAGIIDAILDALLDDSMGNAEAGFEVEHTGNLFDAGRLLSSFRPDFVFLNLELAGPHAATIAESIRQNPGTRGGVRVVGIARDGSVADIASVDDVLQAPIAKKAVRRITGPLPTVSK